MVALMARHLKRAWKGFDEKAFVKEALRDFGVLELKQRSHQIKCALDSLLPDDFPKAAPILIKSLHPDDDIDLSGTTMDDKGIRGWAVLPMTEYVGDHGLKDFDLGLETQKELTKRFSSEFGIRNFILHDQKRALATLSEWAGEDNYHVRRLVSEGSRPRLPWARQLPGLIKNPAPLFPILEKLKDDPSEYVRRSVANNLNDIAKDHPDKVARIAKKWMKKATGERKKLVRHACRTLVKQGHPGALAALGFEKPKASLTDLEILTPVVNFGEKVQFRICLESEAEKDQNVVLDYLIHHRKANGKTSPKVFKWKTFCLAAGGRFEMERAHPIKPITTRTYYSGTHTIEIQLNGESLGAADFTLKM